MRVRVPTFRSAVTAFAVLLLSALVSAPLAQEDPQAAPADEAPAEELPLKFVKLYVEEWKWTPSEIRVPVGTRIKIEALSYDSSRRFDLKAYKLKVALPQDKTVTFEFVADKPGKFRWKCGRPCGNGCAKLTGTLIVE
jgi:heme/copper-type cytochrome/quinol oxidase subunit 2